MGGLTVDDRYEEIFRQYDIKIHNAYRTRGAYILETNHGIKLCRSFEGSKNRVEFENRILEHLRIAGYRYVDNYMHNINNEIVTEDSKNNQYVIKNWYIGEECNLKETKDVLLAAKNLAVLHSKMRGIQLSTEQIKYNTYNNLFQLFEKHNRELKRVRSYVRDKRIKNEFELCFLNFYESFYEDGCKAINILKQSAYGSMLEKASHSIYVCHGNYTYHNIIFLQEGIATTNFDKTSIGVQISDLYHFLRKVMEKNNWDIGTGDQIIEEYSKVIPLSGDELEVLYILLLYPEKFWKLTNYYYNGKKSWVPQKNIQKLINIGEQAEQKGNFLKYLEKAYTS